VKYHDERDYFDFPYFPEGGRLVLGQKQDTESSGFDYIESFSGKISFLKVWSYALAKKDIADYSNCSCKRF